MWGHFCLPNNELLLKISLVWIKDMGCDFLLLLPKTEHAVLLLLYKNAPPPRPQAGIAAQRLSSAAFEATPVFAAAKIGGGSNVRCNEMLGAIT